MTVPPPRRLLAIYSSRKDKKPPARKLLSFRLILGLEKTYGFLRGEDVIGLEKEI
jgi:hypothetical protein